MEKLHASIMIQAPVQKVWHTMLDKRTYSIWTNAFALGSHYDGEWLEGSVIKFLATDADGNSGGMYSKIRELIPYRFVSIEHIGLIKNNEVDTTSNEAKIWTPSLENYTFTIWNDGTEVEIDQELNQENIASFTKMWANALQQLKTISEQII